MVDVTALGSITLVILVSGLALLILVVLRNRLDALQLLVASSGAALLTFVTKDMIERVRPAEAQQLIVVSGFSYPSGHSLGTCALYMTIAIIACRHVRDFSAKVAIFVAISSMVILVGVSRVYLGVHYMTDVVSGISLGAAWALLLAGVCARIRGKA
jgi:undecaprenyl-diphosphatase